MTELQWLHLRDETPLSMCSPTEQDCSEKRGPALRVTQIAGLIKQHS